MANPFPARLASRTLAVLLMIVTASAPRDVAMAAQARLVRCGSDTCLHVSGHRRRSTVAVRIDGRDFAVEGGRAWHMTVPLPTARDWPVMADGTIQLSLADTATGIETTDVAVVPPGALGRRVELATLIVSAH